MSNKLMIPPGLPVAHRAHPAYSAKATLSFALFEIAGQLPAAGAHGPWSCTRRGRATRLRKPVARHRVYASIEDCVSVVSMWILRGLALSLIGITNDKTPLSYDAEMLSVLMPSPRVNCRK